MDPRAAQERVEILELRDCQEPLEHRVLTEQLVQLVLLVNLVPRELTAHKDSVVSRVTLEHLVAPELQVRLEPLVVLEPLARLATLEHLGPPVRQVQREALGTQAPRAQQALPVPLGQLGRLELLAVLEHRALLELLGHRANVEMSDSKEFRAREELLELLEKQDTPVVLASPGSVVKLDFLDHEELLEPPVPLA